MTAYSMWKAVGIGMLGAHIQAIGQTPVSDSPSVLSSLYVAEGHYEYAKDGSATLGLVTQRLSGERVKFTMCDNKTVEVSIKDLRASKARCDRKPKDSGPWVASTNELAPVYKFTADPSSTKVIFKGEIIDLKTVKAWASLGISLPATKASEPVGFVFKDSDGTKAMAIFRAEK